MPQPKKAAQLTITYAQPDPPEITEVQADVEAMLSPKFRGVILSLQPLDHAIFKHPPLAHEAVVGVYEKTAWRCEDCGWPWAAAEADRCARCGNRTWVPA